MEDDHFKMLEEGAVSKLELELSSDQNSEL